MSLQRVRYAGLYITGLMCLAGIYACSDKIISPGSLDAGYAYFPVDSGLFREYLVTEIHYAAGELTDSASWYYKEINQYWYQDLAGDSVLVIERYKRSDTASAWQPDSLIRIRKNDRMVLATENNIPFVKLVFPVKASEKWNGNAFNNLGEEDYHYLDISEETVIMGRKFPATVKVIHKDIDDPIVNRIKEDEIYAREVGLIYREYTDYHYCTDPDCLGKGVILYGTDYMQRIITYGME